MKVVGISGSPRSGGNTEIAVQKTLTVLQQNGIETELISLAGKTISPCIACYQCGKAGKCVLKDADFAEIYPKLLAADGIVLGSPVYFSSATPNILALMDRASFVARMNGNLFRRKVGAAIAIARRAGANTTFSQLNYFFLIAEMIVPGSTYWNVGFGREKGEIENDAEASGCFATLGENIAWLLKKLHTPD